MNGILGDKQVSPKTNFSFLPFFKKKLPVTRQMTSSECGAACLCMILRYFGRKVSVFECRKEMGTESSGVSALDIKQTAQKFDLKVTAYTIDQDHLHFVNLPVIIHWKFNHFVILEKYSAKEIEISDPAIGRYSVTREEFRNSFTGVVMTFEPDAEFDGATKHLSFKGYKYLSAYLKNHSSLILQILASSIIIQTLGLILPFSTKIAVDSILPLESHKLLTVFGMAMVMLLLGQIISSYLRSINAAYLQTRMDSQMMRDLFEHLLSLPLKFFHQRSSGDLIMRMGSTSVIREILTSQTLSIILDGTLACFYLIVIFYFSPILGIAALIIGSIQVGIYLLTADKLQMLIQSEILAQSKSQSYLVESLSRVEFLKAAGKESYVNAEWSALLSRQLGVVLDKAKLSVILDSATASIRILSPLILLWIGIYLVIGQRISLGTMLALNVSVLAFLNPLSSLVSSLQRLHLVGTHLERIEDVFEAETEQDVLTVNNPPALTGRIEVINVDFSYSPDGVNTLNNINLIIEPGQKIAIVGDTGSGKSTLGKLILGLYPLTNGEIRYDNFSLCKLNYQKLRNQIGVVLQEPLLFSGSIRKNIAFGNPNISFDEIIRAAEKANIHNEIMNMPMGYETLIAEGNAGLSGGQSQRVALARAILMNPPILLLDEATSHLDVITESIIDENLSKMNCTRIVIAHRLSTIINSDFIYVLSNGFIIERGTHENLLKEGGHYSKLIEIQTNRIKSSEVGVVSKNS